MVAIFVSSTSRDLEDHRAVLLKSLQVADTLPVAMEVFGAQPGNAVQVSLTELKKADLFIGIYAHRYGYCPDEGDGKSITEMEYDYAVENDIDRLIFVVEEDYRADKLGQYAEKDASKQARLKTFKDHIDQTMVRDTFTTPDDLAKNVLAALARWLQSRSQETKNDKSHTDQKPSIQTGDVERGIVGSILRSEGDMPINFGDSDSKQ